MEIKIQNSIKNVKIDLPVQTSILLRFNLLLNLLSRHY